jgi:hypothetical protein
MGSSNCEEQPLSKEDEAINAKIREKEAVTDKNMDARIESAAGTSQVAVPTTGPVVTGAPRPSVNGQFVNTCSHGGLCHGQMMRAIGGY